MRCSSCNTEIPTDAAFCPKCGQRIGNAPAAAAPLAAVAPTAMEKMRAATPAGAAAHQPEPEHELWRGRYTPKAMYGNWVLAAVVTLAAIVLAVLVPNPAAWIAAAVVVPVVWLALLWMLFLRRVGIEYTLTTQRFIHKKGVLNRVSDQILLVDVDDITYEQSLLGRMLNFGTITLRSKDMSNEKLVLVPVDDVQRIANLIDEARREERRKRAIYMASA
jgi:uncharacterized membrane protein YdbT with pleckstrin-like domain